MKLEGELMQYVVNLIEAQSVSSTSFVRNIKTDNNCSARSRGGAFMVWVCDVDVLLIFRAAS
jgi:hypothetical protein